MAPTKWNAPFRLKTISKKVHYIVLHPTRGNTHCLEEAEIHVCINRRRKKAAREYIVLL